jgi:rod shape-determining protein MreC
MEALVSGRRARRRAATYVALLVLMLVLVATSGSPFVGDVQRGLAFAFRPIQGALDGAIRSVGSIGTAIAELDALRVENDALRLENERLRNDNLTAAELKRENELLTALLQLRTDFQYDTVAASVIARDSSEARRVITIDRGTNDGVLVGHVVIAAGGALVGRVTDVGPNFARVVLVSDPSSTVVGQLLEEAATGKIVGQLGGTLTMGDVDSTATVRIGEEVFTAGIELAGGIRSPYPKGLLVGQVVDVSRDPNEVVQTVFLEPAADLDRLQYVLVITSYLGGLQAPEVSADPCPTSTDGTLPAGEDPCATVSPSAAP